MQTRTSNAARLLVLSSAVALAACQDGLTAPRDTVRASFGTACGNQMAAGVRTPHGTSTAQLSVGSIPQLPGVTITATFPGGTGGLPWNISQQMNFPLNAGADRALCLNDQSVAYVAETLYVAAVDSVAMPPGVDPNFWASLSPRERKVLLARAEQLLKLYPSRYASLTAVISDVFEPMMLASKTDSKVRAADFFGGTPEHEMFAGGVYGCQLYQRFVTNTGWAFSNAETLQMVSELVAAFAEAEFAYYPLRAVRFARNGVFGAGIASASAVHSECGRLIFNSIPGGTIDVSDPYTVTQAPPAPPGGGGYQPTPEPPPGGSGLPPGWYDF